MAEVLQRLEQAYPDAKVGLHYRNSFELLVATILSAQCTDERVNQVTPPLFADLPTPAHFVDVSLEELEQRIHPTGFFRNKARNIQACCAMLLERFNGQVPQTVEELVLLPGVGRKTANCVLSECFGLPAITVDTHVTRVSNLLGFVTTTRAEQIEQELMNITDPSQWNKINLLFITHGRRTCIARRPLCDSCAIRALCPSAQTTE